MESSQKINSKIKSESVQSLPFPSNLELDKFPFLKTTLRREGDANWEDSDWDDRESWGDSWGETV
jgi:hypothetical protein